MLVTQYRLDWSDQLKKESKRNLGKDAPFRKTSQKDRARSCSMIERQRVSSMSTLAQGCEYAVSHKCRH